MRETVRRLLAFVEAGDRAAWVGLALLALVVTVLEVVAALMIFGFTRHIADMSTPLTIPILGEPRQWLPGLSAPEELVATVATIAAFFVARAAVVLLQSYARARMAERAGLRLSSRLLRGYLRMPYTFHLQRNSAELIRNVNDAVKDVVDYTLIPALRITSEVLVIAGLGIALVLMTPVAALLGAVLFIPLVALMFGVVQPRIAALGRTSHEMNRWALGSLQQSLHGYREITLLGRRRHFSAQYEKAREQIGRTRYLRQVLADVPRVALETGLVLFVASFVVVSALMGDTTQQTLGMLAMFAYIALRVLPSLNRLVLQVNDLKYGAAAAADVHRDLSAAASQYDGEPDVAAFRFHSSIRLEGVSYRYPDTDRDALAEVTVQVTKGETVGIVGETGAGKTTLLDVILGLLPPACGQVVVDGVDIHTHVDGWQLNLGVVSQAVYLIDASLRRNIALGVDEHDIDEARVIDAVRLAQLDAFVAALPQGLDTPVGERGIRISGGERQRVAIARALYRRPPVLVLDEGTSALDSTTEAELLRGLESLRQERTIIVVAHRLTTVRDCDRILVMERGRIVDEGTFDDLLERNTAFRGFARTQSRPALALEGQPPD